MKVGGGRSQRVSVPSVTFEGRNLFDEHVFASRFVETYGRIYLRLLFLVWKLQRKI